jgi:pimeloyl-ACP methyl ester carboxylesterase
VTGTGTTRPGETLLLATSGADTLHVHVDGEGPGMVVLHGLLGDGATARGQAPAGYRVAWFDQRGHGDGPPARSGEDYPIDRFVDDTLAVLDRLRGAEPDVWARPALTGNSMGAAVALRLAMDHPDRVSSVVLFGPAFGDRPSPALPRFLAMARSLESTPLPRFLAAMRSDMAARGLPGEVVTAPQRWSRHDIGALTTAIRAVARWVPFTDLARLADLGIPLGVVGWPDDEMHPVELAERIAALAAGPPLLRLRGIGQALADVDAVRVALAAQHRALAASAPAATP